MSNDTMTPEQMRIAIAEACGWIWEEPYNLVSPSRAVRPPNDAPSRARLNN